MWQRPLKLLCVIIVLMVQPLLAVAQTASPGTAQSPQWPHSHEHWHMWGDHPGWHFWWMPLMMIVFIILIFVALRFFGVGRRWHMTHWAARDANSSAIEILNERFAKGEIEESEYKDKKAKILSS